VKRRNLISLKLFGKSKARRSRVEPARKSSEFARPSALKLACHAGFRSREIIGEILGGGSKESVPTAALIRPEFCCD
jgi:hypothetical protein